MHSLGGAYDVLVVDNGVEDDVRKVATLHGAEYVTPGRNVGFAAAVNVGLSRREGRHVLLLNPDARVSPEIVAGLSSIEAGPDSVRGRASLLSTRLVVRSGSSGLFPSPSVELLKAFRLQRLSPPAQTFLIGAVLLLRAEALDDVGLFDERFFLYAEECDWQLRALRRGWRIQLLKELTAQHSGAGSSDVEHLRQSHFRNSARLFGLKWYGRAGWTSMRAASLLGAGIRLGDRRGSPTSGAIRKPASAVKYGPV